MKEFETIGDDKVTIYGSSLKGIATIFAMDNGMTDSSKIIVMAPDWEALRGFWKLISRSECVRDKCQFVGYSTIGPLDYSATEPAEPKGRSIEDVLDGMKVTGATVERLDLAEWGPESLIWMYDVAADKVSVEPRGTIAMLKNKELQEIGPATEPYDKLQCKRALIAKGWSRSDTSEVTIVEGYEDIPF